MPLTKGSSRWLSYILECGDSSLYVGATNNLAERIAAHATGKGAKYTRGRGPLKLRRVEFAESKGAAMRREAELKKLPRGEKLKLCTDASHGVLIVPGPGASRGVEAAVSSFRPESRDHRPGVSVSLTWSGVGVGGRFTVEGDYAKAECTGFNKPVHQDSCVEFFFQPDGAAGYFNFEWNAAGSMLAGYVTDPKRQGGRVAGQKLISEADCAEVAVTPSLGNFPVRVADPVSWTLDFHIPFRLLRKYAEFEEVAEGTAWRANFYKCGDMTLMPHWASWRPLPEKNFHLPKFFGYLVFG